MRNALVSGRRLRRCLRAQGLDVWGLGLLVGFDDGATSDSTSIVGGDEDAGEEDGGGHVADGGQPQLLNASASFARMLPPLTLGESAGDWTYLSSCVVGSVRAAKRVAERVLWLNLEKREITNPAAEMDLVDGDAPSVVAVESDYRPRLLEALRAGALTPYASVLSPALRAQLPKKLATSNPDASVAAGGLSLSPEARLELVSSLWADVHGM